MKKIFFRGFLLLMALASFLSASAQVKWLESEYDFGSFREEAGPQTGYVRFVNEGKAPTIINRVRTSCGCTESSYTEGIIEPGDTAFVSFTYDPKGRPGRFEKTVKVYYGTDNSTKTIEIKGTVIGTPESLDTWFPIVAGPIRLSERILTPGHEITYGQARNLFFQAYNSSSDTIYPAWNNDAKAIFMGMSDEAIAPGDQITFSLYYDSSRETSLGHFSYPIEIIADKRDPKSEKITIEFIADVVPAKSGLGYSELEKAPIINVEPTMIALGEVKKNMVNFKFKIQNTGASTLLVKRINPLDKFVSIKKMPTQLKPNKSADVEGTVNLNSLEPGAFRLKIEIATNDPLNPVKNVFLSGIKL